MPYNYYNQNSMHPILPIMHPTQMIPTPNPFQRKMPEYLSDTRDNSDFEIESNPPIYRDIQYIQGWLSRLIGKYIKVEFLIGTSMLIDREGILTEVGINYIVLKESGTNDDVMCDMYSIKFVRIFSDQEKAVLCK